MAGMVKKLVALAASALLATALLAGCGGGGAATGEASSTALDAPEIEGLVYESSMDLEYAQQFAVHYYQGGYKVLRVADSADYLIVPEGAEAPAATPADMVVLYQPLDNIYLCATATASLINAIGGLDAVTMSGTDVNGWSIDCMKEALESGACTYAGKYSAPDFETLVANGCDLALESTMILHAPEMQEAIENLGIPVFVEHSSYETEPLGRVEWAKAFGAMLNLEDAADAYFASEKALVEGLDEFQNTGKTVAYFSVNSTGSVVVRRPSDFISKSIEIAGGKYAFPDLDDSSRLGTVKMTMEEFYATAVNVDYLVYNGTIERALTSVDDLIALDSTFAGYKAVQEGHVFTVDKDMYQSTDKIGEMIQDFHILVTDGDPADMTFLKKVS